MKLGPVKVCVELSALGPRFQSPEARGAQTPVDADRGSVTDSLFPVDHGRQFLGSFRCSAETGSPVSVWQCREGVSWSLPWPLIARVVVKHKDLCGNHSLVGKVLREGLRAPLDRATTYTHTLFL